MKYNLSLKAIYCGTFSTDTSKHVHLVVSSTVVLTKCEKLITKVVG